MSTAPVRVLLADDNAVLRMGLASLLGSDERITLVAEARYDAALNGVQEKIALLRASVVIGSLLAFAVDQAFSPEPLGGAPPGQAETAQDAAAQGTVTLLVVLGLAQPGALGQGIPELAGSELLRLTDHLREFPAGMPSVVWL